MFNSTANHKVIKTLPVDSNRIYITGLSMGGFGTFDAIERYPNLFERLYLFAEEVMYQKHP